jgi:uncharacterized RDD family membrane protein YckC
LYCGKCGAEVPEGAERCKACGAPVESVAPSGQMPSSAEAARKPTVRYAGFWLRFLALVVDSVILGIGMAPIIYRPMASNVGTQPKPQDILNFYMSGSPQLWALLLLAQLIYWLYYASFESSAWQATPGKRLFGLFVTDLVGKRISFARATGRNFAKLLSQFIFFAGYLMAGFTARKQALHDFLAGCLVRKKT